MKEELESKLRSLVRQYGFGRVVQALEGMQQASHTTRNCVSKSGSSVRMKSKSSRSRPSASMYAAKMKLAPGKHGMVIELASRFEDKTFVPTIGDVRNFFLFYGIKSSRLRSRGSSMVRIFKALASMEETEIKRILEDRLFSGPSRMEPIADAIRRVSLG